MREYAASISLLQFVLKTITLIMCCGLAANPVGISLFCFLLRSHLANPAIATTALWLIDVITASRGLTKSFLSSEACG